MRPAMPAESETVVDMLRAATRGRPAGPWGDHFPEVPPRTARGEVYLALRDGEAFGTFQLTWRDARVWGADGLDGRAGYLHRLAVLPSGSGRGLGAAMLGEAARLTRQQGRTLLRLDVDTGNPRLRGYYERLGFVHVRDVTGVPRTTTSGYRAASLYQRDVTQTGTL
jgi:ribosomal protein S18 acetylase RimI-like enzyme